MNNIDIKTAQKIIEKSIEKGRELKLNPLMVVILDNRGAVKACLAEDGTSPLRFGIAYGKANGAFQMSMGSRSLFNRAEQQAYFVDAINTMVDGNLVPVPGGVLIRNNNKEIIGSLGISGDTSDNDELAAIHGIESVNLAPDIG